MKEVTPIEAEVMLNLRITYEAIANDVSCEDEEELVECIVEQTYFAFQGPDALIGRRLGNGLKPKDILNWINNNEAKAKEFARKVI